MLIERRSCCVAFLLCGLLGGSLHYVVVAEFSGFGLITSLDGSKFREILGKAIRVGSFGEFFRGRDRFIRDCELSIGVCDGVSVLVKGSNQCTGGSKDAHWFKGSGLFCREMRHDCLSGSLPVPNDLSCVQRNLANLAESRPELSPFAGDSHGPLELHWRIPAVLVVQLVESKRYGFFQRGVRVAEVRSVMVGED